MRTEVLICASLITSVGAFKIFRDGCRSNDMYLSNTSVGVFKVFTQS